MTRQSVIAILATLFLGVALAPSAHAQAGSLGRVWLNGTGTDSGNCVFAAPCRTLLYAMTVVKPTGEVILLDDVGYGPVTILHSVSIFNEGHLAFISVPSGGNGITINAGPNDSVLLRGITVDGGGVGGNGIVFNSGLKLFIDQCNVLNFTGFGTTGNGIIMQPPSGTHVIVITNTIAFNNNGAGLLYFPPSGSTASTGFVIDHVSANGNANGINLNAIGVGGAHSASVTNSIASENDTSGYQFGSVTTSLDSSDASGNSTGLVVSNSTVALGRSVITNNSTGVFISSGGIVNSYKNNQIAGNTNKVSGGTITQVNPD